VLVVKGRFAEARVYGRYVLALFRPGIEVPMFGTPTEVAGDLDRLAIDDLKIVVEEGRRQLDRQLADLERTRSRAGTLLTVGLAEIAVLSASAHRVFGHGLVLAILWFLSAALAILAVGGAASLLTSQARFGRTDTRQLATGPVPVLPSLALAYAAAVGLGEETIRTRITILRDGVLLAVVSALMYAAVWPFVSIEGTQQTDLPIPTHSGAPVPCTTTYITTYPAGSRPSDGTMMTSMPTGLTSPQPALSSPRP
jgi:hypothetical protein